MARLRPTHVTTRRAAEMIGYPGRPVSQKLVRTWIRLGVLKATKHIVSSKTHRGYTHAIPGTEVVVRAAFKAASPEATAK
jgi:hypothetical protein